VVAGNTEALAGGDHVRDQSYYPRRVGSSIDEVTHEDRLATVGMLDDIRLALLVNPIAELVEERTGFLEAAMYIADDVERAFVALLVVPERLTGDRKPIQLLRKTWTWRNPSFSRCRSERWS
jgi:hypothetical protein